MKTSFQSQGCCTEQPRPAGKRDGFALVTVLLITVLVASIAIALNLTSRSALDASEAELRGRAARHLADAGLVRAIRALAHANDPLHSSLMPGAAPFHWSFQGAEITLIVAAESGKVDLNTADPAFVGRVLEAVVDHALAARLLHSVQANRAAGALIDDPTAILEPRERLGPLADRMRSVFTVLTGTYGIDPRSAPDVVLRSLPGATEDQIEVLRRAKHSVEMTAYGVELNSLAPFIAQQRPLYRVLATAVTADGAVARREAVALLNTGGRSARIILWQDAVNALGGD